MSSLRSIRVVRPLRTISALPRMRVLVATMLGAIPQIGNVLVLCLFLFMIYGIMGARLPSQGETYRQRERE